MSDDNIGFEGWFNIIIKLLTFLVVVFLFVYSFYKDDVLLLVIAVIGSFFVIWDIINIINDYKLYKNKGG